MGKPQKEPVNYLKYTGMAFQMGLIILIGALAGQRLDAYVQWEKPVWTIVFSLSAVFVSLYLVLKDFAGRP